MYLYDIRVAQPDRTNTCYYRNTEEQDWANLLPKILLKTNEVSGFLQ